MVLIEIGRDRKRGYLQKPEKTEKGQLICSEVTGKFFGYNIIHTQKSSR